MLQVQDQSLRPLTTAHLAQTMSLLVLPNVELRERVLAELAGNPALELVDERVCPNCRRPLPPRGPCPVCTAHQVEGEPIVFVSPRETYRRPRSGGFEDPPLDREPAAREDLPTHVMRQLAANLEPEDRELAAYILFSLDEDGFLADPAPLIARATRSTMSQTTRVLDLIAQVDPPGLGTTGPRQALLSQLGMMDQESPVVQLARRLIEEAFSELGRREYERAARKLGVSTRRVHEATAFIQDNLNPYPARAYWGSGYQRPADDPNVFHTPDIQISQNPPAAENSLVVEIFSAVAGLLRVNPLFREVMSQRESDPPEEWSDHVQRASLFVKCLQQRNNTMQRLLKLVVAKQGEFIRKGDRYLNPMTRAQVADAIGVHESTISRAVAHKAVGLPDGRIIPMSRFFDRSLPIRDRICEIVKEETRPLTDDQISEMLRAEGINVARRTVAKYRAMEGILPGRLRHRRKANGKNKV